MSHSYVMYGYAGYATWLRHIRLRRLRRIRLRRLCRIWLRHKCLTLRIRLCVYCIVCITMLSIKDERYSLELFNIHTHTDGHNRYYGYAT